MRAGGNEYTVVPYKGTAPAFQDLLGGRIDGFIDPILGSLGYHKAGQLRVVAVTSATRTPNLPDVPTVAETIPGFEFYSWYGLWGPAKLPEDIRVRLNAEVNKALASDMREKFTAQGLLLTPGSRRRLREIPARRHGAGPEDHHRRQDTCRVRSWLAARSLGCRSSSRAAVPASGVRSRGACLRLAASCTDSIVAPADARGPHFHATTVDLTDGAQVERCRARVRARRCLVHAAGVMRVGNLGTLDHSGWRVDVAHARRCGHPPGRRAGAGDGGARSRPGGADRQPRRAGHARTRSVRRDQGRARRAGAKLGARGGGEGRHHQRRVARRHCDRDARGSGACRQCTAHAAARAA